MVETVVMLCMHYDLRYFMQYLILFILLYVILCNVLLINIALRCVI